MAFRGWRDVFHRQTLVWVTLGAPCSLWGKVGAHSTQKISWTHISYFLNSPPPHPHPQEKSWNVARCGAFAYVVCVLIHFTAPGHNSTVQTMNWTKEHPPPLQTKGYKEWLPAAVSLPWAGYRKQPTGNILRSSWSHDLPVTSYKKRSLRGAPKGDPLKRQRSKQTGREKWSGGLAL